MAETIFIYRAYNGAWLVLVDHVRYTHRAIQVSEAPRSTLRRATINRFHPNRSYDWMSEFGKTILQVHFNWLERQEVNRG